MESKKVSNGIKKYGLRALKDAFIKEKIKILNTKVDNKLENRKHKIVFALNRHIATINKKIKSKEDMTEEQLKKYLIDYSALLISLDKLLESEKEDDNNV